MGDAARAREVAARTDTSSEEVLGTAEDATWKADMTGADLGRELGVSPRHGPRLKRQAERRRPDSVPFAGGLISVGGGEPGPPGPRQAGSAALPGRARWPETRERFRVSARACQLGGRSPAMVRVTSRWAASADGRVPAAVSACRQ